MDTTEKKKDKQKKKRTANKVFYVIKGSKNISEGNFSETQDKMDNASRSWQGWRKSGLGWWSIRRQGDLLLVILTITATTSVLILIDTRVSVMALENDSRWYARHILTFPAQRATCPARPVLYRAVQKEIGQHDIKPTYIKDGEKRT